MAPTDNWPHRQTVTSAPFSYLLPTLTLQVPTTHPACIDFAVLTYEIQVSHYCWQCFIFGHSTYFTPFSKHYIREQGIFLEISKHTSLSLETAVSSSIVRNSFFLAELTESNSTDWFSWRLSTETCSTKCSMKNSYNWFIAFNICLTSQKGKTRHMYGMVSFSSNILLLWW